MHGTTKDPGCSPGTDAPDVYGGGCANNGLCGLSVVRTFAYRCQRTRGRARAGAATCFEVDSASVQVCGDAYVTKRSKAAVGERQTTRMRVEPLNQAVRPCIGSPAAAVQIMVSNCCNTSKDAH
jgi:hypothetical protein